MSESTAETLSEISKKELLAQTGISYGQLYRWKREGLIPEEWFEKRSAFTGQETFFPRKQILDRLEAIQSMKDGLSLSEIREQLNALPIKANLQQNLQAIPGMNESLIAGLMIDQGSIWLSELSVKAVTALFVALDKAGVSEETKGDLMTQTIQALGIKVSVLPEMPREDEPSDIDENAQGSNLRKGLSFTSPEEAQESSLCEELSSTDPEEAQTTETADIPDTPSTEERR